jgi:hypothetical protein
VECVKEVKRDSWVSFKAKRSTAQVEQLLASSAAQGLYCIAKLTFKP